MPRGNPRLRTKEGGQNLIGSQVKARRKELKMTQDALCGRLAHLSGGKWNPTPADIYRIQTQTRIVSDIELLCLACALDLSISDLIAVANTESATVRNILGT